MRGPHGHGLPHCRHRQHVPATTANANQTQQPHMLMLSTKTEHRQGVVSVTGHAPYQPFQ